MPVQGGKTRPRGGGTKKPPGSGLAVNRVALSGKEAGTRNVILLGRFLGLFFLALFFQRLGGFFLLFLLRIVTLGHNMHPPRVPCDADYAPHFGYHTLRHARYQVAVGLSTRHNSNFGCNVRSQPRSEIAGHLARRIFQRQEVARGLWTRLAHDSAHDCERKPKLLVNAEKRAKKLSTCVAGARWYYIRHFSA